VRLNGKDFNFQPLTVGALRSWLNTRAEKEPNIDEQPIHFLCMNGSEDSGEETRYVTHVEMDAFDCTEEDPDATGARSVWCVSLMHWPNRDKK
jgi:hypothetical protein